MSNVRYQYVSTPRRRHPITVAYTAEETDGLLTIRLGASFCHNKDRFSRQRGREIAQGRMMKLSRDLSIPVDRTQSVAFGKLIAESIDSYIQTNARVMSDLYSARRN